MINKHKTNKSNYLPQTGRKVVRGWNNTAKKTLPLFYLIILSFEEYL